MASKLRTLLEERFFSSCLVHQEAKKNEENSFCMDCCFRLCFHCLPYHKHHSIMQIRRYMYNDVLRYKDAHKIFDCSFIQDLIHVLRMMDVRLLLFVQASWFWLTLMMSYSTNGEKVVLLRPKQCLALTMRDSRCTCLVCNQHIKPSFVYCSLVCKLSNVTASRSGQRVYANSSNNLERSLLVPSSVSECVASTESSVENSAVATVCEETVSECVDSVKVVHPPDQKRSATTSRKCHGRKCVPQRSPFF
ncbi:hypothetical protein CTI12_AA614950 [Artemisia annua]|uniref:PLATZ transcription factor family protein n=1 Tax=Artemisia annua TaxID=35608 RepID=A0A2U1KDL8_ARTAN|nr:hypothetical protein CTI12_AA614950 [Artemisia annua]